jgi:hypothetical protein
MSVPKSTDIGHVGHIGKIRVAKYDYKNKIEPITEGYMNILIHTTGELSPYEMKDHNGILMENFWQFHKIWKRVDEQNQPLSNYHLDPKFPRRWQHPSEIHIKEDGSITNEYWWWRNKGLFSKRWIRYPNGYAKHSEVICSIYLESLNPLKWRSINKIEARKLIYVAKYKEIALQTKQFKELKQMLLDGINIQIVEVDGPTYDIEYPYNQTINSSIEINAEILNALLNNPKQAFGHGYTLAGVLLELL